MPKSKRKPQIPRKLFIQKWVEAINEDITDKEFSTLIGRSKGQNKSRMNTINDKLTAAGYEPLTMLKKESARQTWEDTFDELNQEGMLKRAKKGKKK